MNGEKRYERHLEAIEDAVSRVRSALKVVWQVKQADKYLQERRFRNALRLLYDALILDEKNSYVLRHIAQAKIGTGDYEGAKEAALNAIEIDREKGRPFASNHLRLAESYFFLGQEKRKQAFAEMRKACEISRDVRYRLRFAQMLILDGAEQHLKDALVMLIDIRSQLSTSERQKLAWVEKLRGEASYRLGEYDQAVSALELAAQLNPADEGVRWDIAHVRLELSTAT